jgi:uncharacterized protein
MTFRNYLAASRPDLARPAPVHVSDLQDPSTADVLDSVAFDLDGYDLAWQDYLTCGGFPRAVAEHTRTGAVSTAYLSDLRSWLRADVDPDRPQDFRPPPAGRHLPTLHQPAQHHRGEHRARVPLAGHLRPAPEPPGI